MILVMKIQPLHILKKQKKKQNTMKKEMVEEQIEPLYVMILVIFEILMARVLYLNYLAIKKTRE
jgi:hypothetical protein